MGDLRIGILEAIGILNNQNPTDRKTTAKSLPLLHRPRFIWTGIFIAVFSMAAMGLWHLMGNPGEKKPLLKNSNSIRIKSPPSGPAGSLSLKPAAPKTPTPVILGKDGITMNLIPGGELEIGGKGTKNPGLTIQISSFYMDAEMVTNHHFTDFLNEVKHSLTVENGIVKHKNDIWFYLGEGAESDEPIIFKDGRFILPDAGNAAQPVTRVTWYGASAYARHYGKRLLTESEWAYVVSRHLISSRKVNHFQTGNDTTLTGSQMHTHMMDMKDEFNAGKDRSMSPAPIESEGNFKEWVTRKRSGQESIYKDTSKENIFYPSMVAATSQHPGRPFKNFRYPWEAFSDVGFRCAVSPEKEN